MADQLYGVVPNFSEGRRTEVIEAIVEALHVPGARVVFAEADPDHNRLDTTVLGSADAVTASAMAGAEVAVELIDMRKHLGGHPRMGAADVRRTGVGFHSSLQASIAGLTQELAESYDDRPFNFVPKQGDVLIWVGKKVFVDSRLALYAGEGDKDLRSLGRAKVVCTRPPDFLK